ncbi:hypothetical protein H7F33_02835 [Pedobacter sp. PAMC26386]|nr:hypothetical protein H7F33_02835 [Pedobacter sp. PAMC26386]
MIEVKEYKVLEYVVGILKKAIADSKVEKKSEGVSVIKDGNDTIQLEQIFDNIGNTASILITDKKEIIFSEDLLETLLDIQEGGSDLNQQISKIVINDLSVETEIILHAVKDCFDNLSSSYEFVKTSEKEIHKLAIQFKFGDHKFSLNLINEPAVINLTADFAATLDPAVKKTIEGDVVKAQKAINMLFKEGK